MKIASSEFHFQIEMNEQWITEWIIEDPIMYRNILFDLQAQMAGLEGNLVLSEDDQIIPLRKKVDFIINPLNLGENEKKLLQIFYGKLKEIAVGEKFFQQYQILSGEIQQFLCELCMEFDFEVSTEEQIDGVSLFKSAGVHFEQQFTSPCEQIIQYMSRVCSLMGMETFIIHNLKSMLSQEELKMLYKEIAYRHYSVLIIENAQKGVDLGEKRYIIDSDGCEIFP